MDIFVPPSLNGADAVLAMVSQMENLLDTNKRKAMTDDIVKFHALNDSEAKKAAEARALIKQHTDILEENRKLVADIAEEKKSLELDKKQFELEMQAERAKMSIEKNDVKIALDKATQLNAQVVEMKNNVMTRENSLLEKSAVHTENLKKFEDDKKALENKQKEAEKFRQEVLSLDAATKAKVEKLKQFNF